MIYYYVIGGIGYLMLSVLAAWCGRYRRIGYWGFFFVSLIFTPIISLLFIFFAAPVRINKNEFSNNEVTV